MYSDGWAHVNVPELESFFTPWHGALYAGLAAMAGWFGLLALRGSQGGPLWRRLPRGYGGGAVGVLVFAVGGVADLAWHQVFGIEVAVDALVSPSHLMLGAGGLLMLSVPLRAQGVLSAERPGRSAGWTLPVVGSLVLSTALVGFFLLYLSPFAMPAPVQPFVPTPEGTPGHLEAELPVIAALGGYLVTTVLFTVPLLLMLRSGGARPWPAAVTVLVGALAWSSVAVVDFDGISVAGAAGATAGAVVADLGLAWFGPVLVERPGLLPLAAGGVAAMVWSGQLAGLAVADGLGWPVSLWSGVVVLSGFAAAATGLVASLPAGTATAVPEMEWTATS